MEKGGPLLHVGAGCNGGACEDLKDTTCRRCWDTGLRPFLGPCECHLLLVSVVTLLVHPSTFKSDECDLAS